MFFKNLMYMLRRFCENQELARCSKTVSNGNVPSKYFLPRIEFDGCVCLRPTQPGRQTKVVARWRLGTQDGRAHVLIAGCQRCFAPACMAMDAFAPPRALAVYTVGVGCACGRRRTLGRNRVWWRVRSPVNVAFSG